MVRVSVLYPGGEGMTFDHDYYAKRHMPLVADRLGSFGLIRYEIDRGIGGSGPDGTAPFMAAVHMYFSSAADFQKGIGAHGKEIMADVPNYTSTRPVVQVSEIVGIPTHHV